MTPMQIKKTFTRNAALLATCFLTACSAHVNWEFGDDPIQNLSKETADLAEVTADALDLAERVGPENVLMVFDIDNTLLAGEQDLGADQWYEWQKDLANNDRCSPHNVGNRFAVQGALFHAGAMRLTEQDAANQVKVVQKTGMPVIVLTSRSPDYRLQTFRELRRNGYNFTYSALGPPGGFEQSFIPLEDGRISRYEDGVFMTTGQHKGKMLYALLQKTDARMPKVIVLADDKQKNLDALNETFAALNIPVHTWRYSREDANVEVFDPDKANARWQSIEPALRHLQEVMGVFNYDLTSAVRPADCE